MINYWWITRPKRKLNSIPEVLAIYADKALEQEWQGQRDKHLDFEAALEDANLKRSGERRDHTGGGGRTYHAWLMSLGLVFVHEATRTMKLTLAGEAIMNGESPVAVLKKQILKYQFPSAFSISRGVEVTARFKIRPFRFLLKLLNDEDIGYLTQEEIAKIIVTEADKETDVCYRYIVQRILEFRMQGNVCLEAVFLDKYKSSKGVMSFERLLDLANTIINWLEYTQLIERNDGKITILLEKIEEVKQILSIEPLFIDRPQEQEFFQRKYGIDPKHHKDNRNLAYTKTITPTIIAEQKIRLAYIVESLHEPIAKITTEIIDRVAEKTGIDYKVVEEALLKYYPKGSVGTFMTEYFEMAFEGREQATNFEKATVKLFQNVFGFEAQHVGPIGLTPDVLVLSHQAGYIGILDNKAYSKYSINNDHRNRMVHNYIPKYSHEQYPLAFFSYIAGGFAGSVDGQIKSIFNETNISGSAISVSNMINLVENYQCSDYDHTKLRELFSLNRQVLKKDI
ncbi:MAG: restriction endonuclease FokI C-terminal domain-containing protein [Acidaminococcaceae bacterium]